MLLFDQVLKFLIVAPNRILIQSFVLGILLLVRILLAARLDAPRILLAYNKYGLGPLPSNYTLRIENDDLNDCYEWKTANEHLVTVEPLYGRSDCSKAAVVSVISSAAERIITRLTAKGRSGIELDCDVITDFPDKIELTYLTDELPVDAPPAVITVIAKDKFGKKFTSINGLKFDWKLQQNLDESIKSSDSIVARLRPYSSYNGHPDGWTLRGLLGHSVLVETLNAGSCKIKASVMLTDTLEISTEEARLRILPSERAFPSSVIRLLRYGTVHLGIQNARGEDYKKGFKISVEKPEVVDLKEDSSLLTALEYGQTYVTLKSDDKKNKFASIDVNLEVVKAAKIEIRISGGEFTILEELKSYFISVDLFDENDKFIFPSDNLKLSVSFPTSFYVNSSTSNGTWHFVQALTPGKGQIRAELKGVVLSDGSLLKEEYVLQTSKIVTVSQKLQLFPPFTLLPSDSLSSSFHEIRLMATGGTGKYLWASNNESAVEIRFDDEKSHVGYLQIHKEGDFVVTVTDKLNVNFVASAKVSLQEIIDIETYPTVVEAEVDNILILPIAFLAYEDKERKIVRKFDDCSMIAPTIEIIEKHVLSYDEEPHIPAFGKGCRSLQFRCKLPGHSRINVEYKAKNKETHKTTTVLSCFKNLKPIHPVRVAVLSLGSSMEVSFLGGPRKWPLFKKGHYTTLEPSKPELLSIELVRDPIRYNKDLTVFRVLCKELGENTLTFRIGNEPSATNPHPAKAESSIKVVCSEPHSLHLKLFKKEKKKDFKDQKNIVKVPFYGEKLFAVDVWIKDSLGRKIYNISTVDLKWSLSDETLASVEGGRKGFQTYDNAVAGFRKITRDFKEFKMTGGTGGLQIKAEVLGYRKDALSKVGITRSGNLKEISGSIDVNLVSLRDINAGFYANDDIEKQEKEGTCDGDSCTA